MSDMDNKVAEETKEVQAEPAEASKEAIKAVEAMKAA